MEKYINDHGKDCYRGCTPDDDFSAFDFHEVPMPEYIKKDVQFALHTNLGSLTVVDRLTGFGWRDIETGYRDKSGNFWLASGNYDVRDSGATTLEDAIEWVKQRANTCVPQIAAGG